METLTATAITTLILTKMFEKVGEKMGEKLPDLGGKTLEQLGKLKQLLWCKAPETASAIERVTYQPELVEQESEQYGMKVLTAKLESAAKADPEIAEVIEAIDAEVRPQLPSKVVQTMASGIKAQGSLTAKNMVQKAKPGSSEVNQKMLTDIDLDGDINVSDLIQEG